MSPKALAIDANDFDLLSGTVYRVQQLYPQFAVHARTLHQCNGYRASREDVSVQLRDDDAFTYVTGIGHGERHRFTSLGQTILSSDDDYAEDLPLYRNKVVHLLSCQTATELGPALVRAGCRAFIGYSGDFLFPASPEEEQEALTLAELQALFWECASEIDVALAAGETVEEAHRRAEAAFAELEEQLRAHDLSFAYIVRTQANRARLASPVTNVSLGDAAATI